MLIDIHQTDAINMAELDELRRKCEEYNLSGRGILDRFTLEELAAEYNGAGPDSWIPEARNILTKAMELFKPVVLIHDMQFAQSDGTDEGFAKTVDDWCANTKKIKNALYPVSWKILSDKSYRCKFNYWTGVMPNGDMVGHTGNLDATIIGVESVDLGLARLIPFVKKHGYTLIVTADHGNADEMLEKNKKGVVSVRTAHSLNPVPFIIFNADCEIADGEFGLSNVAATAVKLMGLEPDSHWDRPIIK